MPSQAEDLLEEGEELYGLLAELDEAEWAKPTPFKAWSVNDVVQHLHYSDWMAVRALSDPAGFAAIKAKREAARARGEAATGMAGVGPSMGGGRVLLGQWRDYFQEMGRLLGAADPDARVPWFGPDMGVRMFTTARQMETWAHGQDVYDMQHRSRINTDRIKNIAVIGCRTFGWAFANRGLEAPNPVPHVRLTAPSGEIWQWHDASKDHLVEGSAVEFAHVVTQGRNIADVDLKVVGEPARRWMAIAQCFAGPPKDPPAPGERVWR